MTGGVKASHRGTRVHAQGVLLVIYPTAVACHCLQPPLTCHGDMDLVGRVLRLVGRGCHQGAVGRQLRGHSGMLGQDLHFRVQVFAQHACSSTYVRKGQSPDLKDDATGRIAKGLEGHALRARAACKSGSGRECSSSMMLQQGRRACACMCARARTCNIVDLSGMHTGGHNVEVAPAALGNQDTECPKTTGRLEIQESL